jgi:hypothetical protein
VKLGNIEKASNPAKGYQRLSAYSRRSRRLYEPKPALGGLDETYEGARMGGCAPLFGTDKIWLCSDGVADTVTLRR